MKLIAAFLLSVALFEGIGTAVWLMNRPSDVAFAAGILCAMVSVYGFGRGLRFLFSKKEKKNEKCEPASTNMPVD